MSETNKLYFSKEHEWIRLDGNKGYIGITDYAQKALGDIVFVEMPEVGSSFEKGDVFGTVESVKTVSDVYAPAAGKVLEVNQALEDAPGSLNADPYGQHIAVLELSDPASVSSLMNQSDYEAFCKEGQ